MDISSAQNCHNRFADKELVNIRPKFKRAAIGKCDRANADTSALNGGALEAGRCRQQARRVNREGGIATAASCTLKLDGTCTRISQQAASVDKGQGTVASRRRDCEVS